MRGPTTVLSAILLTSVVASGYCADDDAPKVKFDKAKDAYAKEAQKLKSDLLEAIQKKEDASRKAGNKKAIDQIVAEREAFEVHGIAPNSASTSSRYQSSMKKSRDRMDAAFAAAVREFTKAKLDDEAAELQKEWRLFQEEEGAAIGIMPGAVWEGVSTWTTGDGPVKPGYQHMSRLSITSVEGREFRAKWSWGSKPNREPVDESRPVVGRFKDGRFEWIGDGVQLAAHSGRINNRVMEGSSKKAVTTLHLKSLK